MKLSYIKLLRSSIHFFDYKSHVTFFRSFAPDIREYAWNYAINVIFHFDGKFFLKGACVHLVWKRETKKNLNFVYFGYYHEFFKTKQEILARGSLLLNIY